MALPTGFGIIAYDKDGRLLTPSERQEIINSEKPRTIGGDTKDEWFTPADLPQDVVPKTEGEKIIEGAKKSIDDLVKGGGKMIFNEEGEYVPDPEGISNSIAGRFVEKYLGGIAIAILGIVFIVLALLMTDAGKKAAKMAITKGKA